VVIGCAFVGVAVADVQIVAGVVAAAVGVAVAVEIDGAAFSAKAFPVSLEVLLLSSLTSPVPFVSSVAPFPVVFVSFEAPPVLQAIGLAEPLVVEQQEGVRVTAIAESKIASYLLSLHPLLILPLLSMLPLLCWLVSLLLFQ